jgi:hypothetical protein
MWQKCILAFGKLHNSTVMLYNSLTSRKNCSSSCLSGSHNVQMENKTPKINKIDVRLNKICSFVYLLLERSTNCIAEILFLSLEIEPERLTSFLQVLKFMEILVLLFEHSCLSTQDTRLKLPLASEHYDTTEETTIQDILHGGSVGNARFP